MLGLVSYSNVMDTLLYPPPHTLGLRLPISRRSYNENSPVSPEPDPILEDTPDLLDEQDVDYSVVPPDVGLNVLLNEIGCEVPATDTPSKYGKRALCSFSSNISSTDEDLDDYPFHAVTYGENSSCFGLPYNDHNYASVEMLCKTNRSNVVGNTVSSNAEHEDRLTLLAKLALAKDGKQCSEPSVYSHKFPELNRFQHKPPSNLIPAASSDISQLSSRVLTAESAADAFATSDGLHSSPASAFGADNHTLSSGSARALVLPVSTAVCTVASSLTGSINTLPSASPLQVHRVTSSLTPHVLLRTSLPALQISTTVSRAPYSVDSSGAIRCVCGYTHTDGCVVQCEKCCSWMHADCVAPANGAAIPSPYVCDRCTISRLTPSTTVTIQRHQLSGISGSGTSVNTSIRVSRTAALGTGSSSGRIFVTPATNSAHARQLHLCVPHPSGRAHQAGSMSRTEVQVLPNTSQLTSNPARYISLVAQSTPCITQSQPMRSSKRKQDLLTLTGNSANTGLECLNNSVSVTVGSAEALENQTAELHTAVSTDPLVSTTSSLGSVIAKGVYTSTTEGNGPVGKMTNSSLHRLLMQCPEQQQHLQAPHQSQQEQQQSYQRRGTLQNNTEELRADGFSPSSTLSSDSIRSLPLDGYEEVSDLRISDRLFDKLDNLISPTAPASALSEMSTFSVDDLPSRSSAMRRCQVVCFEFNRKGLVASEDLYPQQPVIEYRGLCMLLSEYNEMYDYRKHYNPFVLFYKTWPKMALCVDARKYGNEARFIRRSCTPNCQVKHCLSITSDPISGPTPRIRLLIVANRPIMRNTELTLPFDFDFTACRYLVKCACARKGCPVARWFRQTTQTDPGSHNSNLMYARKLPTGSRGYSTTARPRGLMSNVQDNYSDILADNFDPDEHYGSSNWSDNRLDTDTVPPFGRLWPHRTFRRVARVSSSVSRPGGITRPVRRRGRSRGRHRGPNTDFGSVNSRASNKSLMKVSRGRPSGGGSRSRIQGHPRRRGMNLVGRPRIHGRYTKPELRSTLKEEDESGTESINSIADSPIKSPTNYSKSRERRQSYLSRNDDECVNFDFTHRWSETSKGVDAPEEDLDRDTEPECGSDQKTISSLDQLSVNSRSRTIVSPKCTPLDDADQRDVSSKENSSAHTPGIEKLPRLERENRKLSRPRNQGTDVVERRKRRTSGEGTAHSPPLRKNISSEESKKKSREEIWMDEVLRRIERMEKKQLQQQKQRPGADKHETEEMSGISAPSMSQAGSESVHDISAKPESDQGPLESVSDIALSVVKPVDKESQTSDMQIASSPSHRAKLHINTIDGLKPETLSEKKMYDTEDAFMKGSDKQSEPRTSISPRSPTKLSDSSKSRMKQKQSGSAVQSKRRRSQTTFLPDNFCTSIERRDSREDRWLKSQLRRIAELEDQPDGSQKESDHTTPIDALTNGSDTSTTSQADDFSLGHTRDLSHEVPVPEACQSDVHMIYQETHRSCPHSSPELPSPEPFSSSNNQPPASNSKDQDSEADCTLIVYRTREKDPMAKFSRNRKTGLGLGTATGDVPINTVCENNEDDMKMACSYPTLTTSTPSTHSAPRPTKKRWLSQALMEEEDSNSNSKIDSVPVADFSSDTVVHVDDAAPVEITNRSTSPNVVTVCPVNPKKRLISQFSVAGEESVCAVSAPADVVPSILPTSAPSTTTLDEATDVSMLSPLGQLPVVTDQTPTEQCTSHSTPLPPKKATVKQQAEQLRQQEMRKVRVSLSEYRRRRGLSSNSSSSNSVKPIGDGSKQPQTTSKNSTIEQLGSILPPGLVDPGILLEELPKFYDQLRLPATVSTEPTQPVEPVVSPATLRSSVDRDSDSLSSKLTHAPLMSVLESRVTERGPRTPSEPPDEEDYEDLDGDLPSTVYCRQLSVPHPDSLTTNSTTGNSNGPCWSSDRSPQRTVDAARPFSTTCSNYTECKLVPVIAHSQFLRAPTRTAVRDAGFFPSTGISQIVPGEAQQSTTSLGGISSGYPGKQAHSPIRASRQLDSNGLHRSSGRIRNHSSLSASADNSIHCSPPLPPPPPPPPPPIRSALSSNTLVDYEATSPMDSGPHVRLSGSDVPATYGEAEHMLKTNSLEYFIRRDQEIRSWQEARSYEWDRRRGSSGNRPSVEVHSHTRHGCQRRHSWRNSAAYAALPSHHPGWSGLDEKCTRHTGSNVAGQLFDVEQTLHRLQDSLRAQLDRTRMALTPHNGSTLNRLPSFHSTGCAVDASDLTPYAAERLEYHRRFSLTEQRIHTNSSPN